MFIKKIIQRSKYGYSQEDIWDFSEYLASIIFKGVKELKDAGHPSCLKNQKEWNDILDNISFAFEMQYKILNLEAIYYYEFNKANIGFYKKYNIKIITKEEEKMINKGMKLFIKYFNGLWC